MASIRCVWRSRSSACCRPRSASLRALTSTESTQTPCGTGSMRSSKVPVAPSGKVKSFSRTWEERSVMQRCRSANSPVFSMPG